MGHHAMDNGETYQFQKYDKRAKKEDLVRSGRAHAALVYDADGLGWRPLEWCSSGLRSSSCRPRRGRPSCNGQ
jgi:hypothetical protein